MECKFDVLLGFSFVVILFGSNDLVKNFMFKEGGIKDGIDWVEFIFKVKDI